MTNVFPFSDYPHSHPEAFTQGISFTHVTFLYPQFSPNPAIITPSLHFSFYYVFLISQMLLTVF